MSRFKLLKTVNARQAWTTGTPITDHLITAYQEAKRTPITITRSPISFLLQSR